MGQFQSSADVISVAHTQDSVDSIDQYALISPSLLTRLSKMKSFLYSRAIRLGSRSTIINSSFFCGDATGSERGAAEIKMHVNGKVFH